MKVIGIFLAVQIVVYPFLNPAQAQTEAQLDQENKCLVCAEDYCRDKSPDGYQPCIRKNCCGEGKPCEGLEKFIGAGVCGGK